MPQGTVKTISVAVLLDQDVRWEGTGPKAKRVLEPPRPEKLKVDPRPGGRRHRASRGARRPDSWSRPCRSKRRCCSSRRRCDLRRPRRRRRRPQTAGSWLQESPIAQDAGDAVGAGGVAAARLLLVGCSCCASGAANEGRPCRGRRSPSTDDRGAAAIAAPRLQQDRAQLAEQDARSSGCEAEALASLKLPPVTTRRPRCCAKHLRKSIKKDPQAIGPGAARPG